jgi:hypothetical protein
VVLKIGEQRRIDQVLPNAIAGFEPKTEQRMIAMRIHGNAGQRVDATPEALALPRIAR